MTLYVWFIAAVVILFAVLTLHTIARTALYRARPATTPSTPKE